MNENEFKEISSESKTENFSVSDEQKQRLSELYTERRVKNGVPVNENFFTRHHTSFILSLAVVSTLIFTGCIVYDSVTAQPDLPVIADENVPDNDTEDEEDNTDVLPSQDKNEEKKEASDDDKQEITHVRNENAPLLEFSPTELPDAAPQYLDASGKYNTTGIANAVIPSIVEINTYEEEGYGSGSGIIMSEDGYIITNAHVIASADSIEVVTADEKIYEGTIIGKDNKTDLAVIKIEAEGLVPAKFGDSDNVMLGEQVMAIGNPGGLTSSITGGYVSGLNRRIKTDTTGYEMNCIQTDAAISPGNSGGALVNMYGQVIGITSSKYISSSFEGLGFAITTRDAKPIIDELLTNGYISGRYKIGINFYSGEAASVILKQEKNLDYPEGIEGILITKIDENCDIGNTELEEYDIITEVEGKKVKDYNSLIAALDGKGAEDTVKAHVVRVLDQNNNVKEFDILFILMTDTSGDY